MGDDASSFSCEFCGEELIYPTKFSFRLLPAKKMPQKSLKLYHNHALQIQASSSFGTRQSKFTKYFHRHSMPRNVLEVRCRACFHTISQRAMKPKYVSPVISPGLSRKERRQQRKSKTPQDLNAGLIIPLSMRSTPSTPSSTSGPTPPLSSPISSLFTQKQELQQTPKSRRSTQNGLGTTVKCSQKKLKKMAEVGQRSKQKEMFQLQQALYKSKEVKSSGLSSLDRFLSE